MSLFYLNIPTPTWLVRSCLMVLSMSSLIWLAGCQKSGDDSSKLASQDIPNEVSGLSVNDNLKCIDEAAAKLGIDLEMKSDVDLFRSVLEDDMKMADLGSLQATLQPHISESISLAPFLQKIRMGIATRHPAMGEFLCEAINNGLIAQVESGNPTITRAIHHTYLLELINQKMADEWEFMFEVNAHLMKKRQDMGISDEYLARFKDIYDSSNGLFFAAKMVTMDWVFEKFKSTRERNVITEDELKGRQFRLVLNIMEAVFTERKNGFYDNALAGLALGMNPFSSASMPGKKRFIEYELPQIWVSLYESWNFAFITGNMKNMDIYYPKLLIPSVLLAESNHYIFYRGLALWPTLNFELFRKIEGGEDLETPNSQELTEKWGEINLKHAKYYTEKENGISLNNFSYILALPFDRLKSWVMERIFGAE
jgi:hypothetical protein